MCVYVCVCFLDTQFDLIYFVFEMKLRLFEIVIAVLLVGKVKMLIIDLLIIGPSRFGNIAVR